MSIEISFLRHAIAAERGAEWPVDAERPLTTDGRRKMIAAARGMGKLGLRFEVLLSSPLLRAVQTAELVKKHLPFAGPLETTEELEPSGSLRALLRLLKARRERSFLLVGHEPALSGWIGELLRLGPAASVEMKKGALCRIALESAEAGAAAELLALIPPKVLRSCGK
ncbi:MAG: phosphohistidine phosphatase SixA [Deltaproteobacteria bacterium]|nr:phosphohistidine phosphatase SixA [Deltaproteobacteria bacterium]